MYFDAEGVAALTDEIATLCGHMHAAEYRLLELIRVLEALLREKLSNHKSRNRRASIV